MHRIERDDGAGGDAEFSQQHLGCWNLVGFLGDVDMSEHEGGVGGKGAEHLSGSPIAEVVEAATQCLAIQRDAAPLGRGVRCLQLCGMAPEDRSQCEPMPS